MLGGVRGVRGVGGVLGAQLEHASGRERGTLDRAGGGEAREREASDKGPCDGEPRKGPARGIRPAVGLGRVEKRLLLLGARRGHHLG